MLMNLFSMFDPNLNKMNPITLMALLSIIVVSSMNKMMYTSCNKIIICFVSLKTMMKEFGKEMSILKGNTKNKSLGKNKLFMTVMFYIYMVNVISLFPYIMSSTSHLSFNLPLALLLWMSGVILAISNSWSSFFSHLTPMGTPIALMSFMVLIETVSNVIRPITLSVRLMANMVAGHLLLTLLSNFSMMSNTNNFLSIPAMMILGGLEMGVAFIQAYVLSLLVLLYFKEAF